MSAGLTSTGGWDWCRKNINVYWGLKLAGPQDWELLPQVPFKHQGVDWLTWSSRPRCYVRQQHIYRAFHLFGQFLDSGSILGSSQFSILPQLPLKTMVSLKVVKMDLKTSNLLHKSKFVTHSVPIEERPKPVKVF